ncbi:hypothetical protein D3C71_1353040 [compost metagenome]
MLASVCTRMAKNLPSLSIAISAWLTWSRPCASDTKDSLRSATHLMLRLSCLAAQVRHTSSAYRKILEPKPPPTSGAITRTLCSGRPITKAVISSRSTCGFWLLTYSVYSSLARLYEPMAARGSIALGMSRLLTRSSLVTCAAFANAASTAPLSPMAHL